MVLSGKAGGWQAQRPVEVVGNALRSNGHSSQSSDSDIAADGDSSLSQKDDRVDEGLENVLQSLEFGPVESYHGSLQRGSSGDSGIETSDDVLQNDEILLELVDLRLDKALSRSSDATSGTSRDCDDCVGRGVEAGNNGTQIRVNDAFSLDNDLGLGADIVEDSCNRIF